MKLKIYKNGGIGLEDMSAPGGNLINFVSLCEDISSQDYAASKSYVDSCFSGFSTDILTTGNIPGSSFVSLISGDLSASSVSSVNLKSIITAGDYSVVTVNSKGLITDGRSLVSDDLPSIDWSKITSGKPTTAGGYGITDALLNTGGIIEDNITLYDNPATSQQVSTKSYLENEITAVLNNCVKTGDILIKLSDSTNPGFLKCNGGVLSKAVYNDLYSVTGDSATIRFTEGVLPGSGKPWCSQYDFNSDQSNPIGPWVTGGNVTVNLFQSHVLVTKDRVYLIGGKTTTNTIATIYTATISPNGVIGTWGTSGTIPAAIGAGQLVVTKNRVYLIGGFLNTAARSSVYTAVINTNGTLGTWSTVASLPGLVAHPQSLVTKTRIYIFGGFDGTASVNSVYSTPVDSSGVIGTWSTETSLPDIISGAEVVVTKNRVYLIGGVATSVYSSAIYSSPIAEDGTIGAWVTETSLPVALAYHKAIVTNSKVYILGGFTGSYINATYIAPINSDGTIGAWTQSTSLPATLAYSQLISVVDRIYTIGGYSGGVSSKTVRYTTFVGGFNDYSPYYDGSLFYIQPTDFSLPDLTSKEVEEYSYFIKT